MLSLKFAEVVHGLFLAGTNFGTKLDNRKWSELVLDYDRTEKELIVTYKGHKAIVPASNIACMWPKDLVDPWSVEQQRWLSKLSQPAVSPSSNAPAVSPSSNAPGNSDWNDATVIANRNTSNAAHVSPAKPQPKRAAAAQGLSAAQVTTPTSHVFDEPTK